MRRNISLYIADKLVDLADDSLVLMNYTFEDLSNPTIVKNSYSKTITLVGTPNNNALFGEIWKVDRVTKYGDGFTGIEFDATRKTPFTIYDEKNTILAQGYCKVSNIIKKGDTYQYAINLFGYLGLFLNVLTYNKDGSLRTLADMVYQNAYEDWTPTSVMQFPSGGRTKVEEIKWAWDHHGEDGDLYNVLNFGVFYEGFPKDFSADKMLSNSSVYKNYPNSRIDEGKTYNMKGRASLIKMGRSHTAWEMKDLRWYLLRPVFSLWEFVVALQNPDNVGGMKVNVSHSILRDPNSKYSIGDLWVTLRRFTKMDRDDKDCLLNVLRSSLTPADYLIGLAKFYGWVIVCHEDASIDIMPRNEFFAKGKDSIEDITDRIDVESVSFRANAAESKYYQMGGAKDVVGEYPIIYKESFGKPYGAQIINTGYDFNDATSILTKENKFVEGCDALEFLTIPLDASFDTSYASGNYNGISNNESVVQELWHGDERKEFPCYLINQVSYPIGFGGVKDAKRKTQMHKRDNVAEDGSNMLVMYRGQFSGALIPHITNQGVEWRNQPYYITDDIDEMTSLNGGIPCWNLTGFNSIEVKTMPMFNREGEVDKTLTNPLYYGTPKEISTSPGKEFYDESIYEKFWKNYLTDRYDTDTKVMQCKVDLHGIEVNQELLGKFFFYGGAYWVLNKVENYSLTTDDLVECEFIKVKDIKNYTE